MRSSIWSERPRPWCLDRTAQEEDRSAPGSGCQQRMQKTAPRRWSEGVAAPSVRKARPCPCQSLAAQGSRVPLVVVFDAAPGVRLVRGRRLAPDRGILHRLLDLRIDDFDLGRVVQLLERILRLLCGQLTDDGVLDLIEGRQRARPLLLDLDDVPAELRLHR